MRKHYLDNIRWATVLLVLGYHVFYIYNALGIPGGLGGFYETQPWDSLAAFVYPWFMVLLFSVAGISARYVLNQQSAKVFVRSKNRKLLVPCTLGLLGYHAILGYVNVRMSGALDMIPAVIRYPIYMVSGIGPLWFIQMLWLFSLLLVLLRKLPFCEKLWQAGEGCPLWLLVLLCLPVWGAAQILNTPVITVYRFGIYLLAYLLGYFVLSHDAVQERLEKRAPVLLGLALAAGAAYSAAFYGQDYTADAVLHHLLTNIYLWLAVLAILGCGKAWFDRTSPFASYMTRASYGIYIVHYLIALLLCIWLKGTALPVWLIYALAIVLELLLAPAVYELLRRIPVIRYITFGIRRKAK